METRSPAGGPAAVAFAGTSPAQVGPPMNNSSSDGGAGMGRPGVPYSPPYVLVPASALQFLPGYAQQMVPAQGVSASSHGFGPAPFGSPGYDMSGRHGNRPLGRMPYRHSPQQGPSSPSDESHPDSLAENLQHLSFASPDKRSRAAAAKRKFKKPCPEELEEARQRTIYVSDLNKGITETELVRWFGVAGHVLECRICSDMNTSKRFAFVEFADKPGFEQGLAKSGEKLNGGVIKVSPSKTPIVPINREFMPRDEKELERCERTVYVNQIDRAVPGSAVEAMFENFCGAIEHVKMKLDKQSNTRIAFIEFKTNDAAKTALGMCGAQLGSSQIRVSPSKTPVRVNS